MKRRLVFLDIDRTQVNTAFQSLVAHQELPYTYVLKTLAENEDLPLVHCSGRSLKHVTRDIFERPKGLTEPFLAQTKAIIASAGTEVYFWDEKKQAYNLYEDYIDPRKGRLFTRRATEIRDAISEIPTLELQSPDHLGPYKISFWGTETCVLSDVVKEVQEKLSQIGVEKNDVTITGSYQGKVAVVLAPHGATKGAAVSYLANKFGVPMSSVAVGGDSMNDCSMLSLPDVKVVLPGNAQQELLKHIQPIKGENLYFSKQLYAAGVLEGLVHFGFLDDMPTVPYHLRPLTDWTPPQRGNTQTFNYDPR